MPLKAWTAHQGFCAIAVDLRGPEESSGQRDDGGLKVMPQPGPPSSTGEGDNRLRLGGKMTFGQFCQLPSNVRRKSIAAASTLSVPVLLTARTCSKAITS